jgi:hypothetical protein
MSGGTKLYCPNCQSIVVCAAVPLSEAIETGGQRLYFTGHADIRWFRRARECQGCFRVFLTGELKETLINELASLRSKCDDLAEENKALKLQLANSPLNSGASQALIKKGDRIRASVPWLYNEDEEIPETIVRDLIRNSVWWLTHPAGKPVRAPKHANNVYYYCDEQWVVDFGANSFLPEMAIRVSAVEIRRQLNDILEGRTYNRDLLISKIKRCVSGCVSNHRGDVYEGYYPSKGNDLVFGVTSVDTQDVADFLLKWSGLDGIEVG